MTNEIASDIQMMTDFIIGLTDPTGEIGEAAERVQDWLATYNPNN